jgi:hypothetical protein
MWSWEWSVKSGSMQAWAEVVQVMLGAAETTPSSQTTSGRSSPPVCTDPVENNKHISKHVRVLTRTAIRCIPDVHLTMHVWFHPSASAEAPSSQMYSVLLEGLSGGSVHVVGLHSGLPVCNEPPEREQGGKNRISFNLGIPDYWLNAKIRSV